MIKPVIICVVGGSGSGKTELVKYMKDLYGLPYVASYTTRAMRDGETNGVEHTFVSEDDMPSKDEMLAYTYFGGHHYWATHAQVSNNVPTTYVIDEKGLIEMKDRFGDRYEIVSINIYRLTRDDIDDDRKRRDDDRIKLPYSFYDMNITNDYDSLDKFLNETGRKIFDFLIEKHYLNF